MYNEVYFFGAELLRPTSDMVTRVFASGAKRTQSNFIATTYNVRSEVVDRILREHLISSPHSIVRHCCAQGLGHYRDRTRATLAAVERAHELCLDITAAHAAYPREINSVVRADLRMLFSWALRQHYICETIPSQMHSEMSEWVRVREKIKRGDAEEILDIAVDDRIIPLFRRSAIQYDDRWPAICGSIFLLGAIRDTQNWSEITAIVSRTASPEIRQAFQDVQLAWDDGTA